MSQKNFKLFAGLDEKRFSFTVIDTKNEEDPKIVHTNQTPVTGVIENKITDPNEVYDILKTNTLTALLKVRGGDLMVKGIHPQANLKVKVEVDTNPTLGFNTRQHYLTDPLPIPILTVNESDLFACKLHAALYRTWKNRVKGRDWYDLIWFIRRKIPLNFTFFKKCMLHLASEPYPERIQADNLVDCILQRLKEIDREALIADVRPFVKDPQILSTWDFDFFKFWIQKIEIFET